MLELLGIPSFKPFGQNRCIKKFNRLSACLYSITFANKTCRLDDINNMFHDFPWGGRGDKIKRDVMISDYKNGDLRIIDIKSFNKALKSTWVKKYLDNDNHGKWKLLFDSEIHDLGGDVIFKGNLNQNDLAKFIYMHQTLLQQKF